MKTTIATLLGLGLLLSACSRHESNINANEPAAARIDGDKVTFAPNAPQLAYLNVEPAQPRKAVASSVNGRLAWNDDITSRVFAPVSGRVVEVIANPGQHVATGQVLARLRSADFGASQADARKAATDLKAAERALNRTRELLAHGAAAEKDAEAAEADYARARSDYDRTQATLALLGGKGETVNALFSLHAPISGVVVDKLVSPGQEVRSDQVIDKPLFVISDPTRLWLFLDVTDADIPSLHRDQDVLIHARAIPDRTFHGRIDFIGEGLDPATRTVKVRCVVDNAERLLRAEMYVTADITAAASSGLDISTRAVFLKDNEHFVFVETAPGQFRRQAVSVGPESNGHSVITRGVNAGERIVTDGSLLLQSMLEGASS